LVVLPDGLAHQIERVLADPGFRKNNIGCLGRGKSQTAMRPRGFKRSFGRFPDLRCYFSMEEFMLSGSSAIYSGGLVMSLVINSKPHAIGVCRWSHRVLYQGTKGYFRQCDR
jgi:hypothetical protein